MLIHEYHVCLSQLHLNEVDQHNKRVPPTIQLEEKEAGGEMKNNYRLREEFPHSEVLNHKTISEI